VKPADYRVLLATGGEAVRSGDTPAEARRSRVLASLLVWEKALRNELVRLRAHKLGKAPERYIRRAIRNGTRCGRPRARPNARTLWRASSL
jgi:hypothetical protein